MRAMRLRFQTLLLIALLLGMLVANVVLTYNVFTEPFPGHNDFLSRWEGARAFFEEGLSPYSEQASLNIQNRIYGRPVIENEDPGFFVYPFYTVFITWPTVYLDYAWASAMWMVLLEVCLLAALFLILDMYLWRPSHVLLTMLLLWSLFDYFAARGLFLGQPSHVVYLMQVLTLWALFKGRDDLAGIALAISTFKPQMGYLIVPFLLVWALTMRRWRFVGVFSAVFGGLMLASFIAQPDWFGDWIAQVRLYPEYTSAAYPDTGSPVWIITQYYLGLGNMGEWALNLVFILPMVWVWYTVLIEGKQERFLWAVMMTLTVTHLVALRTATPHFVVFNLMILFYLRQLARSRHNMAVFAIIIGLFVFSWAQFFVTVQGRSSLEHPSLFLPLPFVMFMLLWLTRHLWWEKSPQMTISTVDLQKPGMSQVPSRT